MLARGALRLRLDAAAGLRIVLVLTGVFVVAFGGVDIARD